MGGGTAGLRCRHITIGPPLLRLDIRGMDMFAMRAGITLEVGRNVLFSDGRQLLSRFSATAITRGLCSVFGAVPA